MIDTVSHLTRRSEAFHVAETSDQNLLLLLQLFETVSQLDPNLI